MIPYAFADRNSRARNRLMISCASAALAVVALAPQSATAQSLGAFRGSVNGTTGSVTRNPVSNTAETITVGSSTATINWSPSGQQQGGGTLDFLPNGNTATFTSAPGVTDYTVLNRIIPDSGQPIALNGHVVSTLQGTGTTGGNIWFYSPNGIVVGSSAVFDVGGLLLTTNDVTSFGTKPDGFTATFSAPAGSTSSIQVQNGAQINALQQNSYVALVAPRIEQGGKVRVNGSAAYAAGEQLSMTMNQGLFDIQVDVGTTDYNGVVHTGETSGPANAISADNHKIYMVAVPKNQAMTMLLGGTVGFDDAVSASVKNGAIILSSGWGVHDSDGSGQYYTATSGLDAGTDIGPGNYTSDVTAWAQSLVEASAESGDIHFAGDLTINSWSGVGYNEVSLAAGNEHSLTVGGTARLSAAGSFTGPATGDAAGGDAYGGDVSIVAYGAGAITTGDLFVDAYGSGQSTTGTGPAGSGYGGNIFIDADSGGAITVNGGLTANANGVGGNATDLAGSGSAGSIDLSVYGGSISVDGDVNLWANGWGGNGLTAGDGYGGSASAEVYAAEAGTGAGLTAGGDFSMQAAGQGGNGSDNATGTGGSGGDGFGGDASFYIDNYAATDAAAAFTAANAEVMAIGTGGTGGNGIVGGTGGNGSAFNAGDCTECGFTGFAQFSLYGGSATVGDLLVYATARGGVGGTGSDGAGGKGGDAIGGYSDINVSGNLTASKALSYDRALAGNGGSGSIRGDGGLAQGGQASIEVSDTGQLTGNVDISTTALGGDGNTAGEADGGYSYLFTYGGALNSGTIALDSSATGGLGVIQGGTARGGSSSFYVDTGSAAFSTSAVLHSDATAGSASSGAGGYAYAGTSDVEALGGTINGGDLTASADATGGSGTTAAGGAQAGDAQLFAYDLSADQTASMTLGDVILTANGTMGTGPNDGSVNGGFGFVGVYSSGATISGDSLVAEANGTSFGGQINLTSDIDYYGGGTSSVDFGSVNASANGGDYGGAVTVDAGNGSKVNLGVAELHANGAFSGEVALLTTNCDCGGGGGLQAPHAAPLPAAGGIAADSLALDTTGLLYISLSGGADVSVLGALQGSAGQSIYLYDDGTGGAIRGQSISLSSITIDGNAHLIGQTIMLATNGYMNVGDVDAAGSATFTAGSLATFNGIVNAPTITVTSGDIDIADGASLGVWGNTNLITLNAVSSGDPIILGDTGGGSFGQYVLNEDGDIHTNALVINAQGGGAGGPDVHVGDVGIEGSQTSGNQPGVSQITVNTDGSVFIDGIVNFANAGATDALTINAGHAIEVNTDSGGVQISDPAGKLVGMLALNADNVWVGSGSILGQLEADSNFTGRNDALGSNAGTANQAGFLRGGTIDVGITGSFFVQNSGTADVGAGIDVGDGDLHITNTGTAPATVIAFGRKSPSTGAVLSGSDFFKAVHLIGTFTADSAINKCAVATCGQPLPPPPPPPPPPPENTPGTDTSSVLGPIGDIFSPGSIDFVDNTSDPNDPRDLTDEQVLDQLASSDGSQGSGGGQGGQNSQAGGNGAGSSSIGDATASQNGGNGSGSQGGDDSNGSQTAENGNSAQGALIGGKPSDGNNEDNSSDDGSSVDPSMRLINTTPVNLQHEVDDPVTSGGDVVVGSWN